MFPSPLSEMSPSCCGVSDAGKPSDTSPFRPKTRHTSDASRAVRYSPQGPAQGSSVAEPMQTSRGAIIATSMCWSNGVSLSRFAHILYLLQYQNARERIEWEIISELGKSA